MAHYLVLTRYVVTQPLHSCLHCTVVPLCKLFDDRHHENASLKKTKIQKEGISLLVKCYKAPCTTEVFLASLGISFLEMLCGSVEGEKYKWIPAFIQTL